MPAGSGEEIAESLYIPTIQVAEAGKQKLKPSPAQSALIGLRLKSVNILLQAEEADSSKIEVR